MGYRGGYVDIFAAIISIPHYPEHLASILERYPMINQLCYLTHQSYLLRRKDLSITNQDTPNPVTLLLIKRPSNHTILSIRNYM